MIELKDLLSSVYPTTLFFVYCVKTFQMPIL